MSFKSCNLNIDIKKTGKHRLQVEMHTFVVGVVRRSGRGMWDSLMFYMVIKSRGRVPSKDSFVARRTAGPGLASQYFFQVLFLLLHLYILLLEEITIVDVAMLMLGSLTCSNIIDSQDTPL